MVGDEIISITVTDRASTYTVTKNAEKVQNITEAIEVYDKWLQEHSPSEAATKAKKPGPEDKPTTVPGLSYKDKEAAVNTLKYD